MKNTHKLFTTLLLLAGPLLLSAPAFAAEHVVKMLNNGAGGMMIFEPAVLSVDVGDTVKFEATDMAHNTASVLTPAGATPWKGAMNEEISITLDTPGVYIYECTPHAMMAMVGVIRVGNGPVDNATLTFANGYKSKFVMNNNRLDTYLSEIE
jgi:pseudoazurin